MTCGLGVGHAPPLENDAVGSTETETPLPWGDGAVRILGRRVEEPSQHRKQAARELNGMGAHRAPVFSRVSASPWVGV
jgi:hypothetical protein